VATDTVPGFEYFNAVTAFDELMGAPQPGDARSNDCNVHC
jgi:hypothetical protein